jgi:hypothetical protein
MLDALSEGCLDTSLPTPCLCGLHRRSVIVVIARDFTDNDATGFNLCAVV